MKIITIIPLLIFSFSLQAQDYTKLAKVFLSSSASLKDVKNLQYVIEQSGLQEYVAKFSVELDTYYLLQETEKNKLKSIWKTFDSKYPEPKKAYNCTNTFKYQKKHKAEDKRANQLSALVSLSKTNYQLCQSNSYRTTNCNAQYSTYMKNVNLYNELASNMNELITKVEYFEQKCNDDIERVEP